MKRRNISFYLPIMDNNTQKVIGHLVDISPAGLLMDSNKPIPTKQNYNLHLDFMEDIVGKASLEIHARSIWCHPDPDQPYMYYAGFEILDLTPADLEVINIISNKYGTE
jgi:hypothetical protein